MAHRKRPDIGPVLRKIAKMVRDSDDPRATALSQLKDGAVVNQYVGDDPDMPIIERIGPDLKKSLD